MAQRKRRRQPAWMKLKPPTIAEARARLKNFRGSWDMLTPEQQAACEALERQLDVSAFCGPWRNANGKGSQR